MWTRVGVLWDKLRETAWRPFVERLKCAPLCDASRWDSKRTIDGVRSVWRREGSVRRPRGGHDGSFFYPFFQRCHQMCFELIGTLPGLSELSVTSVQELRFCLMCDWMHVKVPFQIKSKKCLCGLSASLLRFFCLLRLICICVVCLFEFFF